MMYLRWALCAPVSLAFNLFVMVTSPIWAAWAAIADIDTLPGPFKWVHTHDETIYGVHVYGPKPAKVVDRFKQAVKWLCRNPGYGFDCYVLGFNGDGLVFERGGKFVQFDTGRTAVRFDIMRAKNGRRYFSWRCDIGLGSGRFVKIWIGWQTTTQAGWHILKADLNPFKKA